MKNKHADVDRLIYTQQYQDNITLHYTPENAEGMTDKQYIQYLEESLPSANEKIEELKATIERMRNAFIESEE